MRLQTIAQGFLGFFRALNTGQTPTELSDTVVPVYNVRDHYAVAELVTGNTNMLGGSAVTHTVPAGEMWRVLHVGLTLSAMAAGQQTGVFVRILPGTNTAANAVAIFGIDQVAPAVANNTLMESWTPPEGFMLRAGQGIESIAAPGVATGVQVLNVLIQRFSQN